MTAAFAPLPAAQAPAIVASMSTPPDMPRPDPVRIITPRKHGDVLVTPSMAELTDYLRNRRAPLADERVLPGFDERWGWLYLQARRELWEAVEAHAERTGAAWEGGGPEPAGVEKPWVITGHQVEFYHPGVWAKVAAADALARRSDALALDLLVDHDVLDHMGFEVPHRRPDGHWAKTPVHFAAPSPLPAEALTAPGAEAYAAWTQRLAGYPAARSDTLETFLADLDPASPGHPRSYVPWLSRARRRLETSLGLRVYHVPTSLMCQSYSWFAFVLAWIRNAPEWTAAYNRRLAKYRTDHNISKSSHPIPDLLRAAERYELPFWIYPTGSPRSRLVVRLTPAPVLEFESRSLPLPSPLTPAALRQAAMAWGLQIRPRALTLTMFTRLFLADLFIHGIGGALYDQITDGLLSELFGVSTPYACVSAAWLLPLETHGPSNIAGSQANLNTTPSPTALAHRRHHLAHNPQLALNAATVRRPKVAALLAQRRLLLDHITASLAANRHTQRPQRREWFHALHKVNAELHAQAPLVLAHLDDQIVAARLARTQSKVLLNREYFFALHPLASLREFVSAVETKEPPMHADKQ